MLEVLDFGWGSTLFVPTLNGTHTYEFVNEFDLYGLLFFA
mgnify:CR=1 FL=1